MLKFFKCRNCGNVVIKVVDSTIIPYCCGKEMEELEPNIIDGKQESHLPAIERLDYSTLKVCVGSMPHPMTFEHHISFICLETTRGFTIRYLPPCHMPTAFFQISDDVIAVYAYCNLHGLWRLCPNTSTDKECEKKNEKMGGE